MASQNRIVGLATSNARLSLTVTTNMFRVTKVPNRNVQKYEGKSSLYRVNLPQFTDSLIQLVGRFATRQRICYPFSSLLRTVISLVLKSEQSRQEPSARKITRKDVCLKVFFHLQTLHHSVFTPRALYDGGSGMWWEKLIPGTSVCML